MIYKREKIIIIAGVAIVLLIILAGYIRMVIMRIPVKEVSGFERIGGAVGETRFFSHGQTGKAQLIATPTDYRNENYFYMGSIYTDNWRRFLCFEKDSRFFLELFSKHITAIYEVEPNSEFASELQKIYDSQKEEIENYYELHKEELEGVKKEREKYIKTESKK